MVPRRLSEEENQELQDLRKKLLSLKAQSKNDSEIRALRGAINHHEEELGLQKTKWKNDSHAEKGRSWLIEASIELKSWFVELGVWRQFKLIVMGIAFFYAGEYTNFLDFSIYFKLIGVILALVGIFTMPQIKEFFKDSW